MPWPHLKTVLATSATQGPSVWRVRSAPWNGLGNGLRRHEISRPPSAADSDQGLKSTLSGLSVASDEWLESDLKPTFETILRHR